MLDVTVCGAGPVGAYIALLLVSRHNCKVRVFEKRADLRSGNADVGRSINLILTSRGLHALAQVGLLQSALDLCVPVQERAVHLQNGKVFHQPYGITPKEVNYSVSRTAINCLLIQAAEDAGVKFFFEHSVERVDPLPSAINSPSAGRILVQDLQSQRAFSVTDAHLILGTDGAGSAVRTGVYSALSFAGNKTALQYVQRLGISYKEVCFNSTAEGKYPFSPSGLHIWPRGPQFLMALADKQPSFTGTLYLPDGSAPIPELGDKPEDLASKFDADPVAFEKYLRQLYPDLPTLVPDFMVQLRKNPFTLLATLRSSNWAYSSRAVCLGDAAHAVVPFFGQGMNLGLESAWTLSLFLGGSLRNWSRNLKCAVSRKHVADRLAAFVQFQHPNAKALADMAIYNYTEMSSHVSQQWFQQRKAVEATIEKTFPLKMRSRYYLVTNTLVPYAVVEEAGTYLARTVDQVQEYMKKNNMSDSAKVPREVMLEAIEKHVTPFFQQHGINLEEPKKEYYSLNANAKKNAFTVPTEELKKTMTTRTSKL